MSQSNQVSLFFTSFLFLLMISQEHSLIFFFFYIKTHAIMCGSKKKYPNAGGRDRGGEHVPRSSGGRRLARSRGGHGGGALRSADLVSRSQPWKWELTVQVA
jgi:hypothetical protein